MSAKGVTGAIFCVDYPPTRILQAVASDPPNPSASDTDPTFATVFNRAPLYLAITALATGKFLEVNAAFTKVTGYGYEEAVGKTAEELNLWVDPEVRTQGYEQLSAQGYVEETEARFRTKAGEVCTFLISAELIEFKGKWGVLNAAVDITKAKQVEATLETRVKQRTREVRDLAVQLTLAEATERARLAQLLHDDLQQQLYGVQFTLRDIEKAAGDNADVLSAVKKTRESLKEAVATARTTTANLSPPVLEGEGLAQAFRWLGSDMKERYDLSVKVDAPEPLTFPSEAKRVLLFNLVRELLFNVIKHAGVDEATVSLAQDDEQFVVSVSDLGVGFDPAVLDDEHEGTGLGLSGVRKRLQLFGGHLEVQTTSGEGTRVTVLLPTAALTLG